MIHTAPDRNARRQANDAMLSAEPLDLQATYAYGVNKPINFGLFGTAIKEAVLPTNTNREVDSASAELASRIVDIHRGRQPVLNTLANATNMALQKTLGVFQVGQTTTPSEGQATYLAALQAGTHTAALTTCVSINSLGLLLEHHGVEGHPARHTRKLEPLMIELMYEHIVRLREITYSGQLGNSDESELLKRFRPENTVLRDDGFYFGDGLFDEIIEQLLESGEGPKLEAEIEDFGPRIGCPLTLSGKAMKVVMRAPQIAAIELRYWGMEDDKAKPERRFGARAKLLSPL
ncbi:MAG: hypothetical protein AAF413_03910 [Patescibacteria group bacterium]